ncbi:MAG: hypothetical protein HKN74_14365 [Acidimicrobiia bacterium]|nr:hypothetical protein [Acidimicrobiia bacterium]
MRRIAIPIIALALVATLPGADRRAEALPPGPEPIIGSGDIFAGLYPNVFWFEPEFDTLAGQTWQRLTFAGRFHSIYENNSWPQSTYWTLEEAWEAQSTPFSNLQFTETAAVIASGSLDSQITVWAEEVRDWLDQGGGRSLIIAPLQEMNGSWVNYGMDPTNFKLAYSKIRTIVESTVTDPDMVRWAFAPNGWSEEPYSIADYYPGDGIVDLITLSTYNFGDHPGSNGWMNPPLSIGQWVDEVRDTIPGATDKPMLLSQTASVSSGGDKNQWIRDMFTEVQEDPNLVGFIYFNIDENSFNPDRDWKFWQNDVEYPGYWGFEDGMRRSTTGYQWPLTNWFQPGPLNFMQYAPPCDEGMDCDTLAFVDPGSEINLLSEIHPAATVNEFYYGNPSDVPLMGDWNCNGTATPGMYRESSGFVYLRNSNTFGEADMDFFFGIPGDIPIVGDFNNDGCDTVGIYRNGRVFIKNSLGTGPADHDFWYGVPGDRPFTGDFNGDGVDTVGLYRESSGYVYFRNSLDTGPAHFEFYYGLPSDRILAGDWNGDGSDTVAVYRPSDNKVYFRMTNTFGLADYTLDVSPGFVEAVVAG